MKGDAGIVFTVILTIIILLTIILPINFSLTTGASINQKIEIQKNLYAINNALEAAKLYLETSLKYSAYQAFYDYGKEKKEYSGPQNIEAELPKRIADNMDRYTREKYTAISEDYRIDLPTYIDTITVKVLADKKIKVTASPKSNMIIDKVLSMQKIHLEKNAALEVEIAYPLLENLDKITAVKVKEEVKRIMSSWKTQYSKTLNDCVNKNTQITDLEVFSEANNINAKTWQEARTQFSDSVNNQLKEETKPPIKIEAENSAAEIKHPPCAQTVNDNCDKSNPTFSKTLSCEFTYSYSATIKAEIQDDKTKYPVKTESGISFESQKFISTTPINLANP